MKRPLLFNVKSNLKGNMGYRTFILFKNSRTNASLFNYGKGSSIIDVGNWEGEGVKNWSKLPTDSTKKLPTWGRGC